MAHLRMVQIQDQVLSGAPQLAGGLFEMLGINLSHCIEYVVFSHCHDYNCGSHKCGSQLVTS